MGNSTILLNTEKKLTTIDMSFGTPFINIQNNLIAVGHGKLLTNDNLIKYDETSNLYLIQQNIIKILRKLFGKNFKQNQSAFTYGCITGSNYFSYFIKYNDEENTFFISDFFRI